MNTPHRRKEWLEFKEWCVQRKLKAFPAHPWTVSAYIVWLDANRRYRTMQKRLDVIARVHIRGCVHSPVSEEIVTRTRDAVDRRRAVGPHKSFDGRELLAPKKRTVVLKKLDKKPTLSHFPKLVSRRPQPEA
ncbi:hypothetical protein RYZ26_01255 [Terasakiella sp. A23]|uniref:hypothetical protein n=1 Tax=Terasakiella sp. FCG-A23 TaxID=3080561 RepID=UPI0029536456|nr:hypothetical protein [Terasakiella sp. A23]MDV7338203.1 hypothetical protein [Terasakiella sp. A23]